MKKLIVTAALIAGLGGATATHASNVKSNVIIDQVTRVHAGYFETKYGWNEAVSKKAPVHVGQRVEMVVDFNGHSPNPDDWYIDSYKIIGGNR
jgi:hypothetical protein